MQLSITVDFPDDIVKGPYDHDRLGQLMDAIRATGATRVRWMYYGEVDDSDPRRGNIWSSHWAAYGPATLAALGEPLRAAVKAAHERGLEIFGILKPYNGGLSGTYPLGSPEAQVRSRLQRIGGTVQQVIPFLEQHPEFRLRRRPSAHVATVAETLRPIRTLRLIKADDAPSRLQPAHLRIWTSPNNFQYQPLPIVPIGRVSVEPAARDIRDYHGRLVTAAGAPVRVISLENLELTAPYVVVSTTWTDGAGDFRNTPVGLIEALDDTGRPVELVVATHAATWIKPRDFRTYGLEFDMGYGHVPIALDEPWKGAGADPFKPFSGHDEFAQEALFGRGPAGGFIGLARGKNQYLAAAPCEAYPEIRDLWLGWVRAMLAAGVDGVDLRISAHGCLSDEPDAYGYNEPVLAAYRQRYGQDPIEPAKLRTVRGDLYTDFLREASALVRSEGKRFSVHLHAEAFRPDPVFGQKNGIPANIDFQWRRWIDEGLLDEATLRTSWFEAAEDPLGASHTSSSRLATALADPVAVEMLSRCNARGIPVTLNRYIGRAAGLEEYLDDLDRIRRDARFSGFDVYEFFDLAQSAPDSPTLIPRAGRLEGLTQRWQSP